MKSLPQTLQKPKLQATAQPMLQLLPGTLTTKDNKPSSQTLQKPIKPSSKLNPDMQYKILIPVCDPVLQGQLKGIEQSKLHLLTSTQEKTQEENIQQSGFDIVFPSHKVQTPEKKN